MSWDVPLAEHRLKNTTRFMHQTAGLLLLVTAGLMVVLNRSNAMRVGSMWIVAVAVLGFMLSFALRDVVRRLGHRATEERIIKDIQTYLQGRESAAVVQNHMAPTEPPQPAALIPTVSRPGDAFVPCRAAAFLALKDSTLIRGSSEDLVVFDAMPPRRPVEIRLDLHAILQPVRPNEASV